MEFPGTGLYSSSMYGDMMKVAGAYVRGIVPVLNERALRHRQSHPHASVRFQPIPGVSSLTCDISNSQLCSSQRAAPLVKYFWGGSRTRAFALIRPLAFNRRRGRDNLAGSPRNFRMSHSRHSVRDCARA